MTKKHLINLVIKNLGEIRDFKHKIPFRLLKNKVKNF